MSENFEHTGLDNLCEALREFNGDTETPLDFERFGKLAYIIASAVEADDNDHRDLANFLMKTVFNLQSVTPSSPLIETLRSSGWTNIVWSRSCERLETNVHSLFENYAELLIPDSKLIEGRRDKHNIPDAWISIRGEEIPVEMKRNKFDARAMKQLRRYMTAFNTKRGLAVAKEMIVDCPDDVIFIPIAILEEVARTHEKTY